MNITVSQNKLVTGIRHIERLTGKNTSLPILSSVLIETNKTGLSLSTTNLEIGITYNVPAKVNETGKIAVPARLFSEFLNLVEDEKVDIKTSKNIINVSSESFKTNILGMDVSEFPIIPSVNNGKNVSFNSANLIEAMSIVVDSASLSETRPELSGVYLNLHNSTLEMAATDSFRLAEVSIPAVGENIIAIVPRNTVLEIIRLTDGYDGDINLLFTDSQVSLKTDDFELVSRLIDGIYPDYKKVIPTKFISEAVVEKHELDKAVRLASIFSSNISDLKLKASSNQLSISSKSSNKGEMQKKIQAKDVKENFEITVNHRFLLDGIKIVKGQNIRLLFTGDGSPLVIKDDKSTNQTYVLMPLRS